MQKGTGRLAEVRKAVKRHRFGLILISCFINLLLLVTALYMLQIYDRVLSSGSLDTLFWLTVIALFAIVIYGILEQARRLVLSRAAGFIESALNEPVLRRSMEKRLAGTPPEASVRDVSDLRNYYQSDAALAFLDAPWSVIFLAFIWMLHPALGVLATIGAIILFVATVANDLLTRNRQKAAAASVRRANEAAIRFVEGGETIRPLGMTNAIFLRWRQSQNRARAQQQELGEKTTSILSFTRSLRMTLQVLILGAGAYFVLGGEITAGAMIAASIISGRAFAPIDRLTSAWARHVAASAAQSNLAKLFEDIEREPEAVTLPRPEGRILAQEVSYVASSSDVPILRNVNFALEEPGTVCAIVGSSGAGKSSLCRLLVGAWKPAAGHVRLDGADVSKWDSVQLGSYIGYLPQTVELFPGTVAENIARFGDLDSDAIIRASNLAGVHDMILSLPNGYETDIGPHADRISLGQRQRIGLARALYGDPAFVVLDEPNSNLDGAGDQALQDAIKLLKQRKQTVVIVSHRAEILVVADKVLVLQAGIVAKFGDRTDVLKLVEKPLQQAQQKQTPSGSATGADRRQTVTAGISAIAGQTHSAKAET